MSYYYFNNQKIYYEELGTGTPLVLLHGNTASSKMFSEIAKEYQKNFKVILIDFLGHGKSDRLKKFPTDLWFYEAEQVITFLRQKQYSNVNIIGSSGGALVAINVALEAPDLVNNVIADSFEGEHPLESFTKNAQADRESSKIDANTQMFYFCMHGADWEQVVDNDTDAIIRHSNEIGAFFHKPLQLLKADILLTGSKADEFISAISPNYFENIYGEMIKKINHGKIHLFQQGGHPAMLTNQKDFYTLSCDFLRE